MLALQHIACEPPAAFEDELRARGLQLVRVELDEGEALPDWREFAAIVVMGGPMGAYEDAAYPWLGPEKRLLSEAVHGDVPVWGVCLGAQLLAAALGARVYKGDEPEVGMLPVELEPGARTDPVFAAAPPSFPTLQWHGDTFELPAGATRLAGSPAYRNQAFRVGRSYGLQFHVEVSLDLAGEWGAVPAYAESLEKTLGPGALERLLAELAAVEATTVPLARDLFGRWLELVVGPGAAQASSAVGGHTTSPRVA
ncbi:MAG TPA: type 1 glutamine amidotransferase [Gemmatimonadaceae bacterium]|nr:type 1 glutamine amidotransferase [Gemmatimonadaceae bacterium]